MKHTPGPWNIAYYENDQYPAVVTNKYTVCMLDQDYFETEMPGEEVRANAHLIASAPDLLEFIEEIAESFNFGDAIKDYADEDIFHKVMHARKLIKKARGES